ncbi:lactonase family protein [Lichenifustis flavocetrariae]|uniref:Lactonase family protein n=1 Tax=Lichenifustis flavocetrariae TaxID=2949735 RepID=A0AA42CHC1_9HYPH|nr:lactonase family protein [Lichenifustis flavocetrariae]MCW6507114.1 lactonase family protein [Lichenifustis flavocetrariae]
MLALVGSLTRGVPHMAPARGEGISVYAFDAETGTFDRMHVRDGIDNPCFVAPHPERPLVYAVSEVFGWNEGTLTAYRLDRATGRLIYLNKQPTHGNLACFCGLDRSGRFAVVANYSLGDPTEEPRRAFAVFPLREDGGLHPASCTIQLHGTGPDTERQEQPHGHWIGFSPDNRFLIGVDLGTDRILTYPFGAVAGTVDEADVRVCVLPAGSGPRHLVWHPDGATAFVSHEMANSVSRLAFDTGRGRFTLVETVSTLPEGWSSPSDVSDLQITPSGQTLIVANRGHDGLTVFRCEAGGPLVTSHHISGQGQTPRHLQIDPSGRWLIAAYQASDVLAVYALDDQTSRLTFTRLVPCGSPMCVRFA